MKYVRIKSYYKDGTFTHCEHAYFGDSHTSAIERFRKEYPEHNDCILEASTIDDTDKRFAEWFRVARECGCVHCF